jgi:fructoselysine 6-kinase
VAVVGDNTIDRYLGLDNAEFVGGNALNVAVQLGLARRNVAYFGAIGADREGRLIREALLRAEVGVSGLIVARGETALTEIRLTAGDRIFDREDFGVTAEYFPDPEALADIAAADWIHIGMLPRATEFRRAVRAVNPKALISQDCAVASGYDELSVAFESVSGDRDAAVLAATGAIAAGASLAVVTRGADGSIAHDGCSWWEQDALPIEVVDTTGAGDSFIAGLIAARMRGDDIARSLAQGARWAAVTCQHLAGFPQQASD